MKKMEREREVEGMGNEEERRKAGISPFETKRRAMTR